MFVRAGNRGCRIVGLHRLRLPILTLGAICSLGLTRAGHTGCGGMGVRGRGVWAYRRGLLQVTEPILRKRGSDFSRHAVYNSHGKIVEGTLGWRHFAGGRLALNFFFGISTRVEWKSPLGGACRDPRSMFPKNRLSCFRVEFSPKTFATNI